MSCSRKRFQPELPYTRKHEQKCYIIITTI